MQYQRRKKSMSTFMAKSESLNRKWYVIDAAGKPLGKTAAAAAAILRGKNSPEFTPHVDCGDFVIIINCEKAVLTGRKLEQKYYYRHSGYIGGLKAVQYKEIMAKRPEFAGKNIVVLLPDTGDRYLSTELFAE